MPGSAPSAISLHHIERGEGPAILLLHGLGGDHTIWDPMITGLSQGFRVIAPDLRGHGRSPAPAGSKLTFPEHEADLGLLLESAGVDRVHVVGFSAGALLALNFTLDRPERVASLVSIAGAVNVDNHTRAIMDRWVETYQKEGFDGVRASSRQGPLLSGLDGVPSRLHRPAPGPGRRSTISAV